MIIPRFSSPDWTHSLPPGGDMMPMLEPMEMPNHAKQLLLQLNRQRTKGFLCDVIIVVQNALFRAHKNILAASSVYLKSLVVHDNLVNLDPEMVSPALFRTVLDYIYTGALAEADLCNEQNLGAILAAASYLQLPDLVALCKKKLKRNGSYVHMRAGLGLGLGLGLSSYGKLGRGLRSSTPVIQSCYSVGSRLLDTPPAHSINTQAGELYAPPPTQSSRLPAADMGLAEHGSPQLLGLDLSKRSPLGGSSQPRDEREQEAGHSSPQAGSLLSNGLSGPSLQPGDGDNGLSPDGSSGFRGGQAPGSDSQSRPDPSDQALCQWLKQEPPSQFTEEARPRPGSGPGPSPGGPRYRTAAGDEAEDEKSSCEDTSSEEPYGLGLGLGLGPGPLQRLQCGHMSFEPENLGDNLYVCIPCGKGFPSSEQLNAHVESHTEEELLHRELAEQSSPYVGKSSPGLGDLIRPYRCSSCEKCYKDPATLRQHEKTHWLTRPYPCSICGKKFTQRGTMTRHMRSHLGLKPFACEACGMRFTRQYRLTEHMRIHSGEKPYECQICGGKFAQQRNLISHMKMHTGDCKARLELGDTLYPLKVGASHQDKVPDLPPPASLQDPALLLPPGPGSGPTH
ncbi:hypermethylated in cancer 1 protein [Rhincodon typus]|uniref:hypermethylated in cancer 1 protein n=1 Tax=Rhincodon typus TaxID=259920 RepID=UPI00202EF3D7|nr:hypermethylated in cancer 1 protein [Rhincodon typus]